MERIYLRAYYLKVVHYLFFSLSVFSLTSAIIFYDNFMRESVAFIIFCVIYANVSVFIAYYLFKNYKQQLESIQVIRRYAFPYIVLGLLVFAMTELLSLFIPRLGSLIISLLFINYYYVFIIIIGCLLVILKPVQKLFEFQSKFALTKAKEIAISFSSLSIINSYKIGTNPIIDEILDDIYSNRKYPTPHVQRLEMELIQAEIDYLQSRIVEAIKMKRPRRMIERIVKSKEAMEKKFSDIGNYSD